MFQCHVKISIKTSSMCPNPGLFRETEATESSWFCPPTEDASRIFSLAFRCVSYMLVWVLSQWKKLLCDNIWKLKFKRARISVQGWQTLRSIVQPWNGGCRATNLVKNHFSIFCWKVHHLENIFGAKRCSCVCLDNSLLNSLWSALFPGKDFSTGGNPLQLQKQRGDKNPDCPFVGKIFFSAFCDCGRKKPARPSRNATRTTRWMCVIQQLTLHYDGQTWQPRRCLWFRSMKKSASSGAFCAAKFRAPQSQVFHFRFN